MSATTPTAAVLPDTGYLRLNQIIGQEEVSADVAAANRQSGLKWPKPRRARPALPAIIPVSRTTWLNGVKSGRYPQPVKISARTVAWRVEDIRTLIERGTV